MIRGTAAIVVFALALAAQAAGTPVAFVADLRGSAMIEGDGKVVFLLELAAGTRLLLGTGATVAVIFTASGTEFTAKGPGEFVVAEKELRAEKGTGPTSRPVVEPANPKTVSHLAQTATASLRMRGVAQNEARKGLLEFPVDTRVATLQPVLRWQGEQAVTVSIGDATGKEIWKGPATDKVRLPVKLAPGTRYTWTVTTPKGLLGEAHFETLPAEALGRVEKSRAASKTFSDRLLQALLLRDLGAHQEARQAFAALATERPDLPELAALAR